MIVFARWLFEKTFFDTIIGFLDKNTRMEVEGFWDAFIQVHSRNSPFSRIHAHLGCQVFVIYLIFIVFDFDYEFWFGIKIKFIAVVVAWNWLIEKTIVIINATDYIQGIFTVWISLFISSPGDDLIG